MLAPAPSICARGLGLVIVVALAAGIATAEENEIPTGDRWIPAISLYSALNMQKIDDVADSPQRARVSGDQLKAFASLEGQIELATPELLWHGGPRLFARVGGGRLFDSRHLTAENKPGKPVVNLLPSGGQPPLPGVAGQGTGVRTQFAPDYLTISAGLIFSAQVTDRALHIRPSIEYRRGSVEIEALASHAISIAGDANCPCALGAVRSQRERDHDMLGAGLEVEIDAQRAGPFLLSVFASGQTYRVLTGRKLRVSASGLLDDGVTPLEVSGRTALEHWSFRIGAGVRFRWLPE